MEWNAVNHKGTVLKLLDKTAILYDIVCSSWDDFEDSSYRIIETKHYQTTPHQAYEHSYTSTVQLQELVSPVRVSFARHYWFARRKTKTPS